MEITITMKIENEELKDLLGLQKEKQKVCVRRESHSDPQVRLFDETCLGWSKNPEMNKLFLLQQQSYANEKLRRQGHLFLNEVYDMLGLSRTMDGQTNGWVYDEHCSLSENYVDFGLYKTRNRGIFNGQGDSVLLEFNVDGDILDRVWEEP